MHIVYPIALLIIAGLASFIGFSSQPTFQAALPSATAVFETSLAAPITSSATSLTLSANAVRGGGQIAGYTCLTIDEGSAQHEVVCGTVSGTSVTSLARGISFANGTTTDSDNQFAHRRGANVKITDFPVIQILKAQANGEDTYNNILKYDSTAPDCAAEGEICDYDFITDLAFSGAGVIDASGSAKGVVEMASVSEITAGTTFGSTGARLAIGPDVSTVTCSGAFARVLVASSTTGKLDGNCAPAVFPNAATFSGAVTFGSTITAAGVSNIASTSLRAFTSSTTPTTTWTKPSNLKYVIVEVVGGGGGGGTSGSSSVGASSGGGGGYGKKIIPASALGSTVTVTVGNGGAAGIGGNSSSFGSHCSATGGSPGQYNGAGIAPGGGGGIGSGCDLNISGGGGGAQQNDANAGSTQGGSSMLGGGGAGSDGAGKAGGVYGGGGSGGANSGVGGAGAVGAVIVTEVYY